MFFVLLSYAPITSQYAIEELVKEHVYRNESLLQE